MERRIHEANAHDLTRVLASATGWHTRAAKRLREGGLFGNNPGPEEREDWALTHEAYARWRNGEGKEFDAHALHAVVDARWFIRSMDVFINMPSSQRWREDIAIYMGIMDRMRDHREQKILASIDASVAVPDPPTPDEQKRAKDRESSFMNWYRPIEHHQYRCHETFLQLAAFGSYAHREDMERILQRGDLINDRLSEVLARGTLRYLPQYKLVHGPDAYVAKLFKRTGCWHFRDVSLWWRIFRRITDDLFPKEPELTYGDQPEVPFGLGDRDDENPF